MGSIRDEIIQKERERRKKSGSISPKTSQGNYNRIKALQSRIEELEERIETLENE